MSKKKNDLQTNKQKKKGESKKARKYLKSYFNYKVGYKFKTLGRFFRNNVKSFNKYFGYILLITSIVLLITSFINIYKGFKSEPNIEDYKQKSSEIQPEHDDLQKTVSNQSNKIDEYKISNSQKVVESTNVISKVFKGMYSFEDGKEYEKDRKNNMQYFKDKDASWIDTVYSKNKTKDGESLIDNLNLSSEIQNFNLFTEDPKKTDEDKLKFKAIVEYKSEIKDVSLDESTRTHQTVYDIEFDTKSNKIIKMKKENKLSKDITIG